MNKIKFFLKYSFLIFIAFLPQKIKRYIYNNLFHWDIDKTARIGVSLIDVRNLEMSKDAIIGHFNVFKDLESIKIGKEARIENLNVFNCVPKLGTKHFLTEKDRFPAFIMGCHSAVSSRNKFDCSNTITMGDFSSFVGSGTIVYTHGVNLKECRQETKPVVIGSNTRVYTRCIIVKGAGLPDCSLLGPGSVLHKNHEEAYSFYSGVPAIPVKKLSSNLKFFHRTEEYIG